MTTPQYTYKLNAVSYSIPILHAALRPSSTVLGVFLSSSSPSTSSPNTSTNNGTTEVDEAIPLIHTHTSLSPITEIALSLIEEYTKLQNKRIVGIYIAKDNDSDGLGRVGERVLSALVEKEKDNGIFGLVLDNDKLSNGQFAYTPYIPTSSSTFKPLSTTTEKAIPESFQIPSEELPSKLIQIIRAKKIHRSVRDFDDNLEDPDADWLENTTAKKDITKYLS